MVSSKSLWLVHLHVTSTLFSNYLLRFFFFNTCLLVIYFNVLVHFLFLYFDSKFLIIFLQIILISNPALLFLTLWTDPKLFWKCKWIFVTATMAAKPPQSPLFVVLLKRVSLSTYFDDDGNVIFDDKHTCLGIFVWIIFIIDEIIGVRHQNLNLMLMVDSKTNDSNSYLFLINIFY